MRQLLLGQETEEQGLYCVLSTGSTRFSTSKASAAAELFIISPWELSHATKKPLPASPSTQHDHSKPLTSPVLTVELYSAKRWGADAVIAAGELLLGPLLEQLQPNGPGISVTVVLQRAGKPISKPAKAPSTGAAGASPVADGPDTQAIVLQLSTVTAPAVPEQLLGELCGCWFHTNAPMQLFPADLRMQLCSCRHAGHMQATHQLMVRRGQHVCPAVHANTAADTALYVMQVLWAQEGLKCPLATVLTQHGSTGGSLCCTQVQDTCIKPPQSSLCA